jgi:hypothetical protein
MDHTTSSQTTQHPATKPVESRASGRVDESDAFPPRRISTLPPLDNQAAQEGFLRSPSAVLESIGLRVPAALAAHIIRRSSVPPPPASPSAQASEAPSESAPREPAVAAAAPTPEPSPSVEPSSAPTAIPPARRGKARAPSKKKKA